MHSYFLVFTNTGRVFWIKVHEIPAGSPTAQGKAVVNLLQLAMEDKLATIFPIKEFVEGVSLVMATKQGIIKKTELMNFSRPRKGGIIAINLDEGDELVGVGLTEPEQDIFLGTRQGKVIRFLSSEIRDIGRAARGVKGIDLSGNDTVVNMEVVQPEDIILTVTERGFGKRTRADAYPQHHRGGQGVKGLHITSKNGPVLDLLQVGDRR